VRRAGDRVGVVEERHVLLSSSERPELRGIKNKERPASSVGAGRSRVAKVGTTQSPSHRGHHLLTAADAAGVYVNRAAAADRCLNDAAAVRPGREGDDVDRWRGGWRRRRLRPKRRKRPVDRTRARPLEVVRMWNAGGRAGEAGGRRRLG
jgi:hypothetical protein